ncbi:MAG: CPXCG motif-containing cysteine-rich protein [Pseudomonadales bacterium]
MEPLDEYSVQCPYCGETILILLDVSQGDSEFIEDCSVCCRPIEFAVYADGEGATQLSVHRDDD